MTKYLTLPALAFALAATALVAGARADDATNAMKPANAMATEAMKPAGAMKPDATATDAMAANAMKPATDAMKPNAMKPVDAMAPAQSISEAVPASRGRGRTTAKGAAVASPSSSPRRAGERWLGEAETERGSAVDDTNRRTAK